MVCIYRQIRSHHFLYQDALPPASYSMKIAYEILTENPLEFTLLQEMLLVGTY